MASDRLDRFLDLFAAYPWWVSVAFGGFSIGVIELTAYSLASGPPTIRPVAPMVASLWWIPVILFSLTAALSKLLEKRHEAALKRHKSLQSLRQIPWQEFESLVAAYYRTQGYTAIANADGQPDGGADVVMWKDGLRTLVQCKRLNDRKVTVQQVREFFGVVVADGAARGVFVTTSEFTSEAMQFGLRQAALDLIPGPRFVQLIHESELPLSSLVDGEIRKEPLPCPDCGKPMVVRTAKKGPNPGSKFWGCQGYPPCRGRRSLETPLHDSRATGRETPGPAHLLEKL